MEPGSRLNKRKMGPLVRDSNEQRSADASLASTIGADSNIQQTLSDLMPPAAIETIAKHLLATEHFFRLTIDLKKLKFVEVTTNIQRNTHIRIHKSRKSATGTRRHKDVCINTLITCNTRFKHIFDVQTPSYRHTSRMYRHTL